MAQFIQTTVGPQKNFNGTNPTGRGGRSGELSVADVHGRYQEATTQGNLYFAVNNAAQALSLTGTTTYTGLVVYNPPGSGVNLVLEEAIFTPTIAETGVGAVLLFSQAVATSVPALTTTAVATGATLVTGSASNSGGKPASAVTLATNPVFLRPMYSAQFGTAVGLGIFAYKDEIAGALAIPPGAAVGFVALTTAITGIAYISWEEVPV